MGAQYNGGEGGEGRPEPPAQEGGGALAHDDGLPLARRLAAGRTLLLDGATGTELERRGVRSDLPLWSARGLLEAPETVLEIHRDYVRAGVDALVANTFRTQARVLDASGHAGSAGELTRRAVSLARQAAHEAGRPVLVLGSAPTLEDCYRPDLVPDEDALRREHGAHAANLAAAGVDAVLIETMNTIREAQAATRAAREAGAVAWTSFVSWEDSRLLSGEPLAEALDAAIEAGAGVVGVNCLPPSGVAPCLPALRATGLPFSVYANLGAPNDETGFTRAEDCSPEDFAHEALGWVAAGAAAVGGCCGTTPAHLAAIRRALDRG